MELSYSRITTGMSHQAPATSDSDFVNTISHSVAMLKGPNLCSFLSCGFYKLLKNPIRNPHDISKAV